MAPNSIRAELLSADRKGVLASSVTRSRRLRAVKGSVTLILASPAKIKLRAGDAKPFQLSGRIRRLGFQHPIKVTLAGLPKSIPAPSVVVPAGKSEFQLPILIPKVTKPGVLKGVKLIGASQLGPKGIVKAMNEVDLQFLVVPKN